MASAWRAWTQLFWSLWSTVWRSHSACLAVTTVMTKGFLVYSVVLTRQLHTSTAISGFSFLSVDLDDLYCARLGSLS